MARGHNNVTTERVALTTKLKELKMSRFKIGRDAGTGRFVSIKEANKRPKTTVIETIKKSDNCPPLSRYYTTKKQPNQ